MKTVHLDLRGVSSPAVLHDRMKRSLSLPDHYGRNLDALYDCLGEISEPTHIVALYDDPGAPECVKGALRVLRDSADGSDELSVLEIGL